MKKILVDTNIVIDLLAKREQFYREAQELFTLADEKIISVFVSSISLINTHYILSKNISSEETRKILIKFKVLSKVLPLEDKILDLALASDFSDFEDAVQYYSAIDNKLDAIVTRNKKDYKTSEIPVFTAREFVDKYLSGENF